MINFVIAGIIAIFCLYFAIQYYEKIQMRKKFRGRYFDWGNEVYDFDNISRIKKYWEARNQFEKPEHIIDDNTWDDLDMDYLFFRMNAAQSSVGEEYLYARLRELKHNKNELEQFEMLMRYVDETPTLKAEVLCILNKLGKDLYNNVHLYLYKISEQPIKTQKYYVLIAVMLICGISCFFTPLGFGFLVASFGVNTFVYLRDKSQIDVQLNSIIYISKMAACAKKLSKLKLIGYEDELRQELSRLKHLSSFGYNFLHNANSIVEVAFEYLKIVLMWDFISYNRMISIISKNIHSFRRLYALIGQLDCAIALSGYRKSLGFYTQPDFEEQKNIYCEDIYHPLIKEPVCNSLDFKNNAIITGSNASGKSTFTKALAISIICSQTINTCFAKQFRLPLCRLMTSMAVRDKLHKNESYFMAELKSLKRILDSIDTETLTVCFIDEILKGTNTIERIAASAAILRWLAAKNCLVMVASHDIELTEILDEVYSNYHFEEQITEIGITFNFRLCGGAARTRNAIKLLDYMGFDSVIVDEANKLANAED